jgi:muconolactone D-isomerase
MREFLVETTTTIPEGTDLAQVGRHRAAEAVRAKELAATGSLVRLWRSVGELRSIGLWRAADEAEPHEKVRSRDGRAGQRRQGGSGGARRG